ncbi:integrase core domain-containing protein [Ureibacillus sp. GCM10028918]|uniref:integrase core domain-containing protein n=1 Tax=Ureibacillus sp. GCM10028918 TaxID=3273429 RepID=UPI00361C0ADE
MFLSSPEITSKKTAYRSTSQNPNVERVIRTIKRELLDYIILLNQLYLRKILHEYINDYYNTNRTHQGIKGKVPLPDKHNRNKTRKTPMLNGLYHTYKKEA